MILKEIQAENKDWADRNFGENRRAWCALLGVVEEVGELAHAFLKREQNIRGTKAEHDAKISDAIGDIVIYLCDFCNIEGLDLSAIVQEVWDHVKTRDWRAEREGVSTRNKIENLAALIKSRYYRYSDEIELQDRIADLFLSQNTPYIRECSITAESRIDFLVDRIGIEVKTDGSASQLIRQIHRYLTTEKIDGLIVVTNRAHLTDIPTIINGKPIVVVHLLQL